MSKGAWSKQLERKEVDNPNHDSIHQKFLLEHPDYDSLSEPERYRQERAFKRKFLRQELTRTFLEQELEYQTRKKEHKYEKKIELLKKWAEIFDLLDSKVLAAKALGVSRQWLSLIKIETGFDPFPPKDIYEQRTCALCKESFKAIKKGMRKYCCRACFLQDHKAVPKTIEEKRAGWNARTKEYYHRVLKNDPVYKAKTKIRNDRASFNRKYNKTNGKKKNV